MIGISDLKASKSFCSEGYDRKVCVCGVGARYGGIFVHIFTVHSSRKEFHVLVRSRPSSS